MSDTEEAEMEWLPPATWAKRKGIKIVNADGWGQGSGLGFKPEHVPITEEEFETRVAVSTIRTLTAEEQAPPGPVLTRHEAVLLQAVRAAVACRKERDEALRTNTDQDSFQRLAMEFRRLEAVAMGEAEKAITNG